MAAKPRIASGLPTRTYRRTTGVRCPVSYFFAAACWSRLMSILVIFSMAIFNR